MNEIKIIIICMFLFIGALALVDVALIIRDISEMRREKENECKSR